MVLPHIDETCVDELGEALRLVCALGVTSTNWCACQVNLGH